MEPDKLRELEQGWEDERLHANQFCTCKCGENIELVGDTDIEWLMCHSCYRTGCWIVDKEA